MAELLLPGSDEPVMQVPHAFADAEASNATQVIVHPHPFRTYVQPVVVREGMTLAEIVASAGVPEAYHGFLRVFVGDIEIPRAQWGRVRPKAGKHVYVRATPQGGGGKNILRSILMLVVVVAAIYFAPMIATSLMPGLSTTSFGFAVAKGVIGAGLTLLGTMAVNALIPPPQVDGLASQRALLSGVRNQLAPYADIPRHFGKRRVYPLLAAHPYTEAQGKKRFLRVLLAVGWGPLAISNIKIGETPIANFANVTYEVREGWHANHAQFGTFPGGKTADIPQTIFTNSVTEENFSILIDDAGIDGSGNAIATPGAWETRVTDEGVSEISVDVTLPYGFAKFKDDGNLLDLEITVAVEYRKVGTSTWNSVTWDGNDADDGTQTNGVITIKDKSRSPTARGGRWKVPSVGQYEVRLRRVTPRQLPERSYAQRVEWTTMRSIKPQNPLNIEGLSVIALRMEATDQLNGFPDAINCEVESYLPTYNGTSWTWALSRSPGWAYADLMRRRGTSRLIADARIDTAGIRTWATACAVTAPNAAEPYWQFSGTFERGAIFTALKQVAAHGRASFIIKDGKYSIVRDIAQTVPVQHITPRNSFGYSGQKGFVDLPHALKVQFINASNGYQEDEIIVYDDGYSEANATKFESLDLPGCTSPTQAWREGRYYLAVGQLRPEEHSVTMDIEHMRCTMGDLVRLSHDVLSIGMASGRIVSLVTSGSNITGFILDNEVQRDVGTSYVLRIRRANGASELYSLAVKTGNADVTNEVTLLTPVAISVGPEAGDLFIYGISANESAPMLVKKIEPGPNLTAKLTLVDAQSGVWTADTGTIPAFQTHITNITPISQRAPDQPTFTLLSDETVIERLADGTLQDRIAVSLKTLPSSKVQATDYEVQYKRTDASDWQQAQVAKVNVRQVFISPVVQGDSYDVRVRTISFYGIASDWTVTTGHIVVGKTTPPANVTGFSVSSRVDGVQLSWEPNTEIDVVAYTIKVGTSWDSATLVTKKATGNSLFVGLTVAEEQTFLIRAVDAIGLLSETAASVTASVSNPDNIPSFTAYPQNDSIRFTWKPVDGNGVQYEIRGGDSWASGIRLTRAAGNSTTVKLPAKLSGTKIFWIKSVSSAGLYSNLSRFASVDQAPIVNRNVIVEQDFSSDDWTGMMSGLTKVGTGINSYLTVKKNADGMSIQHADFYRPVALGAEFYARNWLEMNFVATVNNSLTWADATITWQQAKNVSWAGSIEDSAGCSITPYIAIADATAIPTDLIEAFQLDGSTTGSAGTAASASGVAYGPLHFGQGVNTLTTGSLTYTPAASLPLIFTQIFDFRFTGEAGTYAPFMLGVPADPFSDQVGASEQYGEFLLMRLTGSGVTMNIQYVPSLNAMRWATTGQGNFTVPVEFETGDILSIACVQGATERRMMVHNHRTGITTSGSDALTPLGAVTAWRPIHPSFASAPGTLGNIEFRNTEMTVDDFTDLAPIRTPVGYQPFRELVPGDYRYQNAMLWFAVECLDRSLDITIEEIGLNVDVPDKNQRGTQTITTSATAITFPSEFTAPPDVQVTQTGGTTLALPKVTSVTATGFTVQLFNAASPATPVAGTISYSATGY